MHMGAHPASLARRSRVIKRETVRADWLEPKARISRQSCMLSVHPSRQRWIT